NSVTNFLRHLRTPIIFANEVLQGDWEGAEVAATRFFVNSIAGVGGLFDVQGMTKGYEFRSEDFGQTLAVWGVGNGPYLVVPFLGPSTVRDLSGTVVDGLADPFNWIANANDANEFIIARIILSAIDARERNIEVIDELKQSIDYYAAVRSGYAQQRASQIRDGEIDAGSDFSTFDDLDVDESSLPSPAIEGLAEFKFELPPVASVAPTLGPANDDNLETSAPRLEADAGAD
ncbi:MAG: VacJ family lipoprotein, partial [Pseudomonadota bacterium]